MEHTCYRCGQAVDEGAAFCPNCNAPQIRVAVAAENEAATPPLRPGTPDEVQPPARPAGVGYPPPPPQVSSAPQALHWHEAMPGAMLAGIVVALVLVIPLAPYLLWPIAAGVLAVLFYSRRHQEAELTTSTGAKLGAIAGLFAYGLFAVLTGVQLLVLSGSGKLRETMQQVMEQSAARNPNPEAQEIMRRFMTPEGIAVMVVILFVMFLVLFVGLSSIGGVLGAKLMKKQQQK